MEEDIIDVIKRDLGQRYIQHKPEEITWQQWYDFWIAHPIDVIGQELNLPLDQEMIRILTQEGEVYYGSEAFITLDLALERAFRSRDEELVNYFMDLVKERGYLNNRYNNAIIAALENSYDEEALELIKHTNEIELNQDVVITLGKYHLRDFYEKNVLPKLLRQRRDADYWQKFYLYGLIEGRHNKEVLPSLDKLSKSKIYKHAFRGKNYEILDLMQASQDKEYIKEALLAGYYDKNELKTIETSKYIADLVPKYPEVALEEIKKYPNKPLTLIKTCYYPLLDYALQHNILAIPDYKLCRAETIQKYLAHPSYQEKRRDKIEAELSIAIESGREDLAVLLLPYLTSYDKAIRNVLTGSHKDILLYLIRKRFKGEDKRQKKDILVSDLLEMDEYSDEDINLELDEYLARLGDYSVNSLETTNSLELLTLDK